VALCLRYFGAASIVLFERNEYRKRIAEKLGFSVIDPSAEGDIPEQLRILTGKPDADLVFDCAAHPSVQTHSLKLTRIQGTMIVVGSYKKPPEVDLLSVEFKEQRILGTRVYKKEDFSTAVEMISGGTIDLSPLLTVFPPEDAGMVFQSLIEGADVIKALFRME
jgi:threonine dehydrogenase-like Zn-dependent dehydrogenase